MKVKCPVIFARLRHQLGESSIGAQFRLFEVQLSHLGIILEELLEACLQPTLSPRYFEIQIFDLMTQSLKNYGTLYFHFSEQRSLSNTDLNINIIGAGAL